MPLLARTAAIGALVVVVAACSSSQEPTTATDPSSSDRSWSQVLSTLRAIDPCTLYGPNPRVGQDPITVVGMTSTLSCIGRIDTSNGPVDVSLGVNISSPRPSAPAVDTVQTIDGVEVTIASSKAPPLLGPRTPKLVTASCDYTARYPDRALVGAYVSASPQVDTCAIAETVIREAIATYRTRPHANPNTPGRTALSGADPCAAARQLESTHDVGFDFDNSSLSSCFFTLDGSQPIVVSFDYLDATTAAYNPTRREVNGHHVFGDGDDGIVHVVVGGEITVGSDHFVPTVTITDQPPSPARMAELISAVTTQYRV